MVKKEPIQLDYGKSTPPPRPPRKFVGSLIFPVLLLVAALITFRSRTVNSWIGYVRPALLVVIVCLMIATRCWDYLHPSEDDGNPDQTDADGSSSASNRRAHPTLGGGTLGIGAGTFRGVQVGCVGGAVLVVFTVLCVFSLLLMVWWPYLHK
ncbi:MAG TPA: hypothetical protein VIM11_05170 [Tepidisphaeraceae bacterium]|jgi:hypothetical protein